MPKSRVRTIKLSDYKWKQMAAIAKVHHRSVSSIIKEAIDCWLRDYRKMARRIADDPSKYK